MNMPRFLPILWVILALCLGCESPPIPSPASIAQNQLSYVQDNQSTREQILLQLGEPTGTFENGRILTFRLHQDPNTQRLATASLHHSPATGVNYSIAQYCLVLVFSSEGKLARHSLIAVR